MKKRIYLCIDLKSFYASVECVERGLDPLTTNLVVADPERSEKTICLAISPSMKALGIPNRCRVFQIPEQVDYIMAPPRMQLYIDYSAEIYGVYLKYIAKEDIHVYSIDEAFMDVTDYLHLYQMTAKELGVKIMQDVLETTGITATCGIGDNLYLAKIALDITAKHAKDHIGILTEESYCKTLWNHKPLKDFWRIGPGIAKSLERVGIFTMGDIAKADEDMLYKLFGIDAELLIDHAWGRETTTMADIKNYKPKKNSLYSGQVLSRDYDWEEGLLVAKEMAESLSLELVAQNLAASSLTLQIGFANHTGKEADRASSGFTVPSSSAREFMKQVETLYETMVEYGDQVRRLNLTANQVAVKGYQQLQLFDEPKVDEKEEKMQKAMLAIKERYGKNAILRGMDLQESATTRERNRQIGGHKSGE